MLRARWLGEVRFRDAHALQTGLHEYSDDDYLLLLEHSHVVTLGLRAKNEHVLVDVESLGADLVRTNRGGDVTYHGPGQLVAYPIVTLSHGNVLASTPAYVHSVEQIVIDSLTEIGVEGASRMEGKPGVWIGNEKIAAIGVRLTRGRTMHGLAINVDPDMTWFERIVPCGISDLGVTSIKQQGVDISVRELADVVAKNAAQILGHGDTTVIPSNASVIPAEAGIQQDPWGGSTTNITKISAQQPGEPVRLIKKLEKAGVDTTDKLDIREHKPDWLRVKANMGKDFSDLKKKMRSLDLVTVCEEAGCPNIHECWNAGTATFMVLGERCTRNCGFCLIDTRKPFEVDVEEPKRVAKAVKDMGLKHAVLTMVARDDLDDGGALIVAESIDEIHATSPGTNVEVLVSDHKGDPASLQLIFDARPDVFNHNVETVVRLQSPVRSLATYARSLAVLSRAKRAGLVTKSGMMVGLGEEFDEIVETMRDLRAVGVDIVTIGQYLRPTQRHLPVMRWYEPAEFDKMAEIGMSMGFSHVQASPLTRSSYHARDAATKAASNA